MHHRTADDPRTAGRVIHRARWYDLFGTVISFGRDKAIRDKLIELAAPTPGENVLDVGCGTGTLAVALKSKVGTGEVHGIDASPEMIEVANEKSAKDGSDIDFQVALIEAIPFPDASFDLVTSSLMLHHLPDDLKRTGLAEIRRVLKPGGRFMAMDLAADRSHSPLGHLLSIIGHAHGEDMVDKLASMLEDAGFGDIEAIPTRHKSFAFIRTRLTRAEEARSRSDRKEPLVIAEARVETERSSRFLVQLCRHVKHLARAHPQMQAHVEWSDDRGVISFGWGRCTLRAEPGALTLRAEAPDEESLQRIEQRVADHLERFGRRDHLTVTWTPSQGEQLPRQSPRTAEGNGQR